jgi:hypothetical protein
MTAAVSPDLAALAVPIDSVKPYPGNPRRGDVEAIRKSLRRFGQQKPIVVQIGTDLIVAGNQVWEAMKAEEAEEIAVVRTSLTETEARAYLLTDNRMSELGRTDTRALMEWLGDLAERSGIDDALGYPDTQIHRLLRSLTYDPDSVEAPPAPEDSWVKTGDGFILGQHRLVCGDSATDEVQDRLTAGLKVNAILTDPPYGIKNVGVNHALYAPSRAGSRKSAGPSQHLGKQYRPVAGDDVPYDPTYFVERYAKVAEQFWFGANYYRRLLSPDDLDGAWLVWDKRTESMDEVIGSAFELCWSKQKHQQRMLRHTWSNFTRMHDQAFDHPTQKPVGMLEEIITRWIPADAVILDPYAGSGSTLIAAENTGRTCLTSELEPAYVQVVIDRWERLTGMQHEPLP